MLKNLHQRVHYADGELRSKRTNVAYKNYDRDGYIRVRFDGKEYRAHRLIWELHFGEIPENMFIDHIDGNPKNNDINNLRLVTRQQNNANRSDKKGLPKGVSMYGGKFRVRISYLGEAYSLGTFDTVEEAEKEYKEAADILNGEYAAHHRPSH
jgi:hypothetical protein